MEEFWRSESRFLAVFMVCGLYLLNLSVCWSLNDEGVALLRFKESIVSDPHGALSSWIDEVGVENPCSWLGVGCSEGFVVVLNLKDLCLRGTVVPDIGNLSHLKSIIFRNNSFFGIIPEEIATLKELEVLDLRYNNFSGQLPCHLGKNFHMVILLLNDNELLDRPCPEYKLSGIQMEEDLSSRPTQAPSYSSLVISWKSTEARVGTGRKLLQDTGRKTVSFQFPSLPPLPRNIPAPSPVPFQPRPIRKPRTTPAPVPSPVPPPPPSSKPFESSSSPPTPTERPSTPTESSQRNSKLILSAAIGGPLLLLSIIIGIFCCRSGKVSTVRPWATGLSGQLQRALVTGVPKLKRSELETACEDFSNVIGSLSVCTLYKGTLSSGVEIAVASVAAASRKDWSSTLGAQFRKQIDMLSKVNHKNFVSLLGYCEEEEPFTRMMVFEYAPNGTLFEHLHIREAEHLDWETRLRIAMGMAYCLDHMHRLTPAFVHRNLTSSSVYLTEDYAAQVSDFHFLDKGAAAESQPTPGCNVYSFGVVLFEMITGKLPYSSGSDSIEDWASDYLRGAQALRETVDPTLTTYRKDQLQQIEGVIKSCTNPDTRQRPAMSQVCARLREVTGIGPDEATPKLSPLWWAELEIMSPEVS